jgi:hypothetical protein
VKFFVDVIGPLAADPRPQRFVLLAPTWRFAMALLLLKLDKLQTLHVPFLILFRHGSQKALLKAKVGG